MHAIYGVDAAYAAWNATFRDYLTTELYPTLNCSFMLVPLVGETAVYNAVGYATIDLVWSNAVMHSCLEVSNFITSCMVLVTFCLACMSLELFVWQHSAICISCFACTLGNSWSMADVTIDACAIDF